MTTRVQRLGVAGLVTNGRVRDIGIIREMGFPMFTTGISVSGTQKHVRPSEMNVPVKLAGVDVNPNDILFGEWVYPSPARSASHSHHNLLSENGVVSIPLEMIDQVMEEVEKGVVLDARCLAELEAGTSIRETFDKHRHWGFTTKAK